MDSMPQVGTKVLVLPDDDTKPMWRGVVIQVYQGRKDGRVRGLGRACNIHRKVSASELQLVD